MQEIFRRVFAVPDLVLSGETRYADIPGWDSLSYVNVVFNVEQAFGLRFSDAELEELHDFQTVGELMSLVELKATPQLA